MTYSEFVENATKITEVITKHLSEINCNHNIQEIAKEIFED